MANSRDYARGLVGDLDRSIYNTQREVSNRTFNTNWESLQNQYKNLTDRLKRDQAKANSAFSNAMTGIANSSFDRMRGYNADLVDRGVLQSGLTNLVDQAETQTKGQDVLEALGKQAGVSVDLANELAQSNQKMLQKESDLVKGIADTLGNIGDAETAAQMDYNDALAGIAGAKDARDDSNDLAAKQRAANAASSSSGSNEYDDELAAAERRVAIAEILASTDLTDKQKEHTLAIMTDVKNSSDVVKAYNKNIKATETFESKNKKDLKSLNKKLKSSKSNTSKDVDKLYDNATQEERLLNQLMSNQNLQTTASRNVMDYLEGTTNNYENMSREDIENYLAALWRNRSGFSSENSKILPGDMTGSYDLEKLIELYGNYKSGADSTLDIKRAAIIKNYEDSIKNKINDVNNRQITYEDLAKLLYG